MPNHSVDVRLHVCIYVRTFYADGYMSRFMLLGLFSFPPRPSDNNLLRLWKRSHRCAAGKVAGANEKENDSQKYVMRMKDSFVFMFNSNKKVYSHNGRRLSKVSMKHNWEI